MLLESIDKAFKNNEGKRTKQYLHINGIKQGIIIESINQANPVLLFLHGGPGFPIYPFIHGHDIKLEEHFTVCYWDQRGAGMSYHKKETKNPLTLEQLINDTIQVTNYLRDTFSQDKIFLLGHSWGTYLGSLVASKYPNLYHAYIGVGQIGAPKESEKETYEFILRTAKNKKDKRAIKEIENVSFDQNYYNNHQYGTIRSKYTDKYGGGFKRNGFSFFENLKDIYTCRVYSIKERTNILRGGLYSYKSLSKVMATTDLVELVPNINLPVFILHGFYDYQTTYTQAKRFYESVRAPYKKMYTFHHSAHTPFIEEKNRFNDIIQEIVTKVANQKS